MQQPAYADSSQLDAILLDIRQQGRLVSPQDCATLRRECAAAASGKAFIVQAGDCAESLDTDAVAATRAMSALIAGLAGAVDGKAVAIARIAGQFAKPRSQPYETRGGLTLPAYRGDSINGRDFDSEARAHQPSRLLAAYRHAAASFDALQGLPNMPFASHEALILPYEEALTVRDEAGRWWAGSGHMLWIGDRTRQIGGAHVAFCRGIENVVGVKCGPTIEPSELVELAEALDPERTPGKLLLIGRFGADRIESCLPPLLRAARREGLAAAWMIDPMHGNTRQKGGRKQRRLSDMAAEIESFFAICHGEGVTPAGMHLEVTAGSAAECIGSDGRDPMADFPCDPRLNAEQAHALVVLAAECRRISADA